MSAPSTSTTAARMPLASTKSRTLFASLRLWWQGKRDLKALDQMSGHGLADVGLMRHEPLPRDASMVLHASSNLTLRERPRTGQRRP